MVSVIDSDSDAETQILLAEYSAGNSVYLQYDGFRWQAGSFLIAGVFIYWGFLIQSRGSAAVIGVSSLLVAALMSCWIMFAMHYRQLYLFKLNRLQEIEARLGMEQHRRFIGASRTVKKYTRQGIAGHHIDQLVYVITAVGGSILAWTHDGFSWWDAAVIPLVLMVLWRVRVNEKWAKLQLT